MKYIKNIDIYNFRRYLYKKICFNPGINIIVGPNASGKTSIVEAVGFTLIGKSFKDSKEKETINDQSEYFSIVSNIIENNNNDKIVVYLDSKGKKISKNEQKYSKISDFIGETGLVSFSPDDLSVIKGSPSERRKYIDLCICQLNKDYLIQLGNYNKILKERNEYLKSLNETVEDYTFLDVLDEKIIELGSKIVEYRDAFINSIKEDVNNILKSISCNEDTIELIYVPKIDVNKYPKSFLERRNHDIYMQTTTGGPHRDDLIIKINNKNALDCASQGQIRSSVLALKMAFYEKLKENNKSTIVIMDDVLSELDENRQNQILKLFKNESQIFITCTNINLLNEQIIKESNVIYVGKE